MSLWVLGFPFKGLSMQRDLALEVTLHPLPSSSRPAGSFPVILFVEVLQWSLGKPFGPFSSTGHDGRGLGLRASLSGLESRIHHFFPVSCGEVSSLGFSALDHPLRTFVSPPVLAVSTKWDMYTNQWEKSCKYSIEMICQSFHYYCRIYC